VWLLRRSRWARYLYCLGVYDGQVPNAFGETADRLRASGLLLDQPRHRAGDKPTTPGGAAWEVGVG
jgi:hypothetical protein